MMSILKIPRGRVYFSGRIIAKTFCYFTRGPVLGGNDIVRFEKEFANYIGVKHAIATYSGTLSLCLCLEAFEIKEGDEIILPAYIVPEVVDVIKGHGAIPNFIDIDPMTYTINADLIEEKIGKNTKIILAPHLYGQPCEIEKILKIARKHHLKIIEDCAQSCGAEYKDRKTGSFGDVAFFSLGIMKNMNTLGGGMIVTSNDELAHKIRKKIEVYSYPTKLYLLKKSLLASVMAFLTHPIVFTVVVYPFLKILNSIKSDHLHEALRGNKKTDVDMRGISLERYRLKYTNLQARIGLEQFKTLERNNQIRIENAVKINQLLSESGIAYPKTNPEAKNIYLNYVIQVHDRQKSMKALLDAGIDTTTGYLDSFSDLPFSCSLARDNIYLPIHRPLKHHVISKMVDILRKSCNI